jgi:hypothetical protein
MDRRLPWKTTGADAGSTGGSNAVVCGIVFKSKPLISRTRSTKPTGFFRQT